MFIGEKKRFVCRTSPTIEEPVRVVGEARRFTLPAYEYPASDTG